jgi:preprotein translocase subunit SecE
MFSKFRNFIGDVRSELQKTSWPWDAKEKGFKKYKELVDSTVVVLVASALLGAYIATSDYIILNVVGFLTSPALLNFFK